MKYKTISVRHFFPAKGSIYYVAIATVIFSHVKITCYFHMWTPRGQLLRNKHLIPVTNIAELVEHVLPLHNNDVTKHCALNTFLDGLAELGVDKGLIKNKKLLSDLIEKEKG